MLRDLVLDHAKNLVGFVEAALIGEPARRFRHEAADRQDDERGDGADQEHCLPAEMGHHPAADRRNEEEADREPELEAETVAAAMRGFGELADIARKNRDLATETEALDRAH